MTHWQKQELTPGIVRFLLPRPHGLLLLVLFSFLSWPFCLLPTAGCAGCVISKVTISDRCQENETSTLCYRHLLTYKEAKVPFISYLFGTFYHVMLELVQCQVSSAPMPPALHMMKVFACPLMLFFWFSRSIFAAVSLKWKHSAHTHC